MASGSRGRGQGIAGSGAGGDALHTVTNPDLAHLSSVDLVVRLHRVDRDASDFGDVALLLAARERKLDEAEDRVRAADEEAAGLQDTIQAANAEALARRKRKRNSSLGPDSGGVSVDELAVAPEDNHQQSPASLEPQIEAAMLTGGEIRSRDLTASETIVVLELPAGEIEGGEITPAEVGDNMTRPIPLSRMGAALPAAGLMPDELAEERAVERVVVDVAVRSSHEVAQAGVVDSGREEVSLSEVVAGKRKKEPAPAFLSPDNEEEPLNKKLKLAGALGVASEDSDSNSHVEETEEELWKKLDIMKAQVAAWEAVDDVADATQGTLQAATPPPAEEVQTVTEVEAGKTSEATVARLQEKIILCEKRLEEIKDKAEKTEERLCVEITKCKEKAAKTEAVLREEILLARSSAGTELEVWKQIAIEAQAQSRANSMTVARICDEMEAWKHRASETETRLQTQEKNIAGLQDQVVEGQCKFDTWIRVSDAHITKLQDNIEATKQDSAMEVQSQIRRATMIEEDLRAKIHTLELKVANLLEAHGSNTSRNDHTIAIDEHNHSRMAPKNGVHTMVPTGAPNKRARRQKGVSFYNEVFKSEMEKAKLIAGNEENEERLKKKAADAASKALYDRCFSQAPYLPAQLGSQTVEEDSGEEA